MLRIGQAAKFLNCTIAILRGMDKSGELVPDFITGSGHRYYSQEQLQKYKDDVAKRLAERIRAARAATQIISQQDRPVQKTSAPDPTQKPAPVVPELVQQPAALKQRKLFTGPASDPKRQKKVRDIYMDPVSGKILCHDERFFESHTWRGMSWPFQFSHRSFHYYMDFQNKKETPIKNVIDGIKDEKHMNLINAHLTALADQYVIDNPINPMPVDENGNIIDQAAEEELES